MAWRMYRTPLATHVAPEHDIRPHEFILPCWCNPRVDHPHSEKVIHQMFLPDETEEDDVNPDEHTEQ